MKSALWIKLGRFRLNMAQIAYIERDEARLLFFNAHGDTLFEREFESRRQADQVLRDFFGYEDVQLVTARYEGTEPPAKHPAHGDDGTGIA